MSIVNAPQKLSWSVSYWRQPLKAMRPLKPRGGLNPVARDLIEIFFAFLGGARRPQIHQHYFIDARVAIALEIIGGDLLGVGRNCQLDVGALASVGLEQLLDA